VTISGEPVGEDWQAALQRSGVNAREGQLSEEEVMATPARKVVKAAPTPPRKGGSRTTATQALLHADCGCRQAEGEL
jgi:hypothetical protein